MKVLIVNGSPRKGGNTAAAIAEMEKIFAADGIETEVMEIGKENISGCKACGACAKLGKCVNDDIVNTAAAKLAEADGFVVASPVYYASANGTVVSFMDRLFYSSRCNKSMKVGAAVAVARRGGCSATFDQLNKYFTISGMPVASSCYWNSVHGRLPGEAAQDKEGMQTVRILAHNMSFLMKSIALGKEKYGMPDLGEPKEFTSFVR